MLLPPDELTSLTLDTQPGSELAALLCHQADETCGVETSGWRVTAEQRFQELEAHAEERASQTRAQLRAACEAEVDRIPEEQRLRRWIECVDEARDTHAALPLGRFRVPTTGWIVREYRRGASQYCDEIHAYDLATGAAYMASSCGRQMLTEDGSHLDRDATDRTRRLSFAVGQVPLDSLREAALITMVASWSEEAVADEATTEPLPANVPLEWHDDSDITMRGTTRCGGLPPTWEWVDNSRSIAEGIIDGAVSEYADELWEAVDVRLAPGCPLVALPVIITPAPRPAGTLNWTFDDLASALSAHAALLACPATRGRESKLPGDVGVADLRPSTDWSRHRGSSGSATAGSPVFRPPGDQGDWNRSGAENRPDRPAANENQAIHAKNAGDTCAATGADKPTIGPESATERASELQTGALPQSAIDIDAIAPRVAHADSETLATILALLDRDS